LIALKPSYDTSKLFEKTKALITKDSQKEGVKALLLATKALPVQQVAYLLATSYHETAHTMQPITEYGGVKYFDKYDVGTLAKNLGNTPEKDGDGYLYRGRGFVQITGRANYQKASTKLGVDFIRSPDLALRPDLAAKILVLGTTEGWFTGKKLSDYLSDTKIDYVNARRVINGTDKASTIASYAKVFEQGLLHSRL